VLLLSLATLFISLFSPFLGYIFIVVLGGERLFNKQKQRLLFFAIVVIGLISLYLFKTITVLEISDVLGSVMLISWFYMVLLLKTEDYSKALFSASLSQIIYGIFRSLVFDEIYTQRIKTLFSGYKNLIAEGMTSFSNENGQFELILEQVEKIMLDYQPAIWTIMMIMAVYLATLFFARRHTIEWHHYYLKIPYVAVYLLISALLLAIVPSTRLWGLNLIIIVLTLFLLQGLAIIDYWSKKFLKKNRFIMIAVILLMFLNIFFALIVSLLGLLDNWLDTRKINHI
jgi:hypothetical protein